MSKRASNAAPANAATEEAAANAAVAATNDPPPPAATDAPDPAPTPPKVAAPTLGRVVLFTDSAGHVAPAVVNAVNGDGTVGLEVFYPDGVAGSPKKSRVPHCPPGGGRGWHWPPRS